MAIGSSDVFKHSVDLGVGSQTQHANTEKFAQKKANEAKIVTPLSSSKNMGQLSQQEHSYAEKRSDSPDFQELVEAIEGMSQLNIKLSFDVSDVYKENIIKVVDQGTGELVRQIPTEEFLEMSERIQELLKELGDIKGALVNGEA